MDYSKEILSKLKSQSSKFSAISSILEKQPLLTSNHLSTMQYWVFQYSAELFPKSPTIGQSSWLLLLLFLTKVPLKSTEILDLLAWTAITISGKFQGLALSPEGIRASLAMEYSVSAIITTELYVTQQLQWEVNMPTAYDVLSILLEAIGCCEYNKTLEKANKVVYNLYADMQVVSEGVTPIAIASLMEVLPPSELKGLRSYLYNEAG